MVLPDEDGHPLSLSGMAMPFAMQVSRHLRLWVQQKIVGTAVGRLRAQPKLKELLSIVRVVKEPNRVPVVRPISEAHTAID